MILRSPPQFKGLVFWAAEMKRIETEREKGKRCVRVFKMILDNLQGIE